MKAKAWHEFINTLHKIDKKAYDNVADFIMNLNRSDFADEFEYNKAIVDYAYATVTKYGEASAALACQMYEESAKLEGITIPPAVPAKTATYTETAIAVNGARMQGDAVIPNAVSRLVRQVGQDTTLNNALRDGAYFAWVPNGDTCAFCIMLASNGWQRMSKKALKGGHAEHIHANCDCAYTVSFNGPGNVEGYDPEKYYEMYNNAANGNSTDKNNALRRKNYAKNKVYINAQKRKAYAERKVSIDNKIKQQAEILQKYGSESEMMIFGSYEDADLYNALKKETGLSERAIYEKISKDADGWESLLKQNSDSLRKRLGIDTLKNMNSSDLDALKSWTGSMYGDINRYKRYGINVTPIVKSIADRIEIALNKSVLPETVIAKRGIEKSTLKYMFPNESEEIFEDIQKLVGKTFKDDGFFATSPHIKGGLGGGVKLYVKVPEGTNAAYIESIAHNEMEYELLLQRGYSYKVVKAGYEQNVYFKDEKDPVLWIEVLKK